MRRERGWPRLSAARLLDGGVTEREEGMRPGITVLGTAEPDWSLTIG